MIDLGRFKYFNDSYGYLLSDETLKVNFFEICVFINIWINSFCVCNRTFLNVGTWLI